MNEVICPHCKRRRIKPEIEDRTAHEKPAYGYVVHSGYGCDTGCCGHFFVLSSADGRDLSSHFEFDHPDYWERPDYTTFKDEIQAWAHKEGVHVHWDECELSDD